GAERIVVTHGAQAGRCQREELREALRELRGDFKAVLVRSRERAAASLQTACLHRRPAGRFCTGRDSLSRIAASRAVHGNRNDRWKREGEEKALREDAAGQGAVVQETKRPPCGGRRGQREAACRRVRVA